VTYVSVDIPDVVVYQDEDNPETCTATVIGYPRDDIESGMVRINAGPVSIEVSRDDLARALRVFE